jgi:hypothetical protein
LITDNEDFAVPFAGDDPVIECGADDPDFGDPVDWSDWTDSERYELGPPALAFEMFHQKLLACGLSVREAEHHALFCTFRLWGMSTENARADASEIFPKIKDEGSQKG